MTARRYSLSEYTALILADQSRLATAAPAAFAALLVFVSEADRFGNPPWTQEAYKAARKAIDLVIETENPC